MHRIYPLLTPHQCHTIAHELRCERMRRPSLSLLDETAENW